ncbi:hypothetical protein VP01_201g1 [Puccinia sorghi]|uniref:Uncharacterized protein n=1 Tax=Puccinia sorghi TaxID=27349 RepID=A0A0L6VBR6_9BASI|nr:hypothetical protein VP01_201g1 [Puccinia sorghi]
MDGLINNGVKFDDPNDQSWNCENPQLGNNHNLDYHHTPNINYYQNQSERQYHWARISATPTGSPMSLGTLLASPAVCLETREIPVTHQAQGPSTPIIGNQPTRAGPPCPTGHLWLHQAKHLCWEPMPQPVNPHLHSRQAKRPHAEIFAAAYAALTKRALKNSKAAQATEKKKHGQRGPRCPQSCPSYHGGAEVHLDRSWFTRGFVAWTTFVHKHTGDMKESFLLIKDVDNQVIFCRYKALMIQYKVHITHSGSAGLHEALAQHGLSKSAWNYLSDMHADNPVAFGFSLVNIGSDLNLIAANPNANNHAGAEVGPQCDDHLMATLSTIQAPGDSHSEGLSLWCFTMCTFQMEQYPTYPSPIPTNWLPNACTTRFMPPGPRLI